MQLNEGLEKLGAKEIVDGKDCEGGVFRETAIENIRLPSTLKRLEANTFSGCKSLELAEISEGMEQIGRQCF